MLELVNATSLINLKIVLYPFTIAFQLPAHIFTGLVLLPDRLPQAAILCVAAHLISVHGIAAALLQLRENLAAWMS